MKKVSFLLSAILCVQVVPAQDVLQVSGNSSITVEKNASIYVGGGISLENNAVLSNEGLIMLAKTNTGNADFTDNTHNRYHYGAGSFVFSGSGVQNVRSNNHFGTILVDNKGLNLLSDISAGGWSLNSGVVNTGNYYAIAASGNSNFQEGIDNDKFSRSWINGNLRQYISAENENRYVLPVGDAYRVKVCEMDNLSRNPLKGVQYVNVSFARPSAPATALNTTENGMKYKAINTAGMWTIIPDAKPLLGSYDLRLSVADFAGLYDNEFGLLNRPAADWVVPAGSRLPADGNAGRTVASGFAQRNNISQFNQFAVASMGKIAADAAASYKIYPDPVTDNEFFIQVNNSRLNNFKMFAADGKEIKVNSAVQKNGQVKVSLPASFAKGNYIVQLNTDMGLKSCQVIVQ